MKLNVTVDLDEKELRDYFDETGDMTMSEAIKHDIIYEIRNSLYRNILNKYEADLKMAIKDYTEKKVEKIINDFVNSDEPLTLHPLYFDNETEEMSCKRYIKLSLENQLEKEGKLTDCIEMVASDFVRNLKKEYDKKFAAKIVGNMKKLDLLKDDKIAELLQ